VIEVGLVSLVLGFIAGYILHGWEFDRHLLKLEQRLDEAERRMGSSR